MKFVTLASGSGGNSTFVHAGKTRLLIDNGLSLKELSARLATIGERLENIDGLLVTHEHRDHVLGVPMIERHKEYRAMIYANERTMESIQWEGVPERVDRFISGEQFQVGEVEVMPFSIPHDAAEPVGFILSNGGVRLGVVTDLGYIPPLGETLMRQCDALAIESNYEAEMLKIGPYPWSLKQRIMSRVGHLSNHESMHFLSSLEATTRIVVIAHMSPMNNNREIVRLMADNSLKHRPEFAIAEQNYTSKVFEV